MTHALIAFALSALMVALITVFYTPVPSPAGPIIFYTNLIAFIATLFIWIDHAIEH